MKVLFTFYFLLFTVFAFSQTAPGIEWQNTIGGNQAESLNTMQQTTDGGYIFGGYSDSNISGDKTENNIGFSNYWIVKTDAAGIIEWDNTIGGDWIDYLNAMQQTTDGGYILAGSSESGISGDKNEPYLGAFSDFWIIKLSSAGSIEWQNTIGGDNLDEPTAVQQTADGGYIIGGTSNSNISYDKSENSYGGVDYWILKLDSTGLIEWQKTIGGNSDEYLAAIQQTIDGGYIIGGYSTSDISGNKTENSIGSYDWWIVKISESGTIEWQNTIGGSLYDTFTALQQTTEGRYIIGGYTSSDISGDKTEAHIGNQDYWIMQLGPTGSIEWQNTIGGTGYDYLTTLDQTADGGYILGGYSGSNVSGDKTEPKVGNEDYWILKTDNTGTILWQNTIGGAGADYCKEILQTTDGGYLLAGNSFSNVSGDKTESNHSSLLDFWIIKLYHELCSNTPTGLLATNITTTKAKLHWAAYGDAIKYKLQYRATTSPAWITVNATTNLKLITGLVANTTYKYRVRSQCGGSVIGPWSAIETFTTLPLKEMSNELSVMNIYPNPNNGNFTIQFPELDDEVIFISIKNMLGEEIYAEQINASALNHTISLDKNISAGMYFCDIQTKNKMFTQQIIITK